jgi:hypothetical protein
MYRGAEKGSSRNPGFRCSLFSETNFRQYAFSENRASGIVGSRELEGFIVRRKGPGILAGTANAAPSYFLVLGRRAIRQTIGPTAPIRRHTPELPCRSGVLQRWASLPRRFWPFAPVL